MTDEDDSLALAACAAAGDQAAWSELVRRHRPALLRAAEARLARPLRPRLDAEDVVQEALADASGRLGEYLRRRPLPLPDWLRQRVADRVARMTRFHFGAGMRSPEREACSLDSSTAWGGPAGGRMAGSATSPSGAFARGEARQQVAQALARLRPVDREILHLFFFQGRDLGEAARILGLTPDAARVRRARALRRLAGELGGPSGGVAS